MSGISGGNFTYVFPQPSGLQVNQRATSYQLNQLDLDGYCALNRFGGNIEGQVYVSGPDGIVEFQSGSELHFDAGSYVQGDQMNIDLGGNLYIDSIVTGDASLQIVNGSYLTVDSASTLSLYGYLDLQTGSSSYVDGYFQFDPSSYLNFANASTTYFQAGSTLFVGGAFNVASAPTYITPKTAFKTVDFATGSPYNSDYSNWQLHVGTNNCVGGIRDINASITAGAAVWAVPLVLDRYNGATLSLCDVIFQIYGATRTVPAYPIQFTILRHQSGVAGTVYLNSGDPQTFGGSVWTTSGLQTFTYTPNQNNVINTDLYSYWALLTDESGGSAVAGNTFINLYLGITNITTVGGAL